MAPSNQPNISKREWFRWADEAPNELTNTIVLTSAQNHYVDIRVLHDLPNADHFDGIRTFAQLDWAFAGTSSSQLTSDSNGQPTVHSVWKHFIDSRYPDAEKVLDEGDMVPTMNDTTVERGSMLNPATGHITPYEECWSTTPTVPTRKDGKIESVVLVRDEGKEERGVVVRVGQFCQGVVRSGGGFALERWRWDEGEGWRRAVRMGDVFMPCGAAMGSERVEVGDEVKYQEQRWKVVEKGEY